MKNILIINGNPKLNSFTKSICDTYQGIADENCVVKRFDIQAMDFNSSLDNGYDHEFPIESSIKEFQQALSWSDHVLFVSPIWWGGIPGKLKGLLDRALLPSFAFSYESSSAEQIKLLSNKTIRIILTMDAPEEYLEYQARSIVEQLDVFTFQFCGFEPAECTLLGSVLLSDEQQRVKWLDEVKSLSHQDTSQAHSVIGIK